MPTGLEEAAVAAGVAIFNWIKGFGWEYKGGDCPGCRHRGRRVLLVQTI